jgi:hypothetical protein
MGDRKLRAQVVVHVMNLEHDKYAKNTGMEGFRLVQASEE